MIEIDRGGGRRSGARKRGRERGGGEGGKEPEREREGGREGVKREGESEREEEKGRKRESKRSLSLSFSGSRPPHSFTEPLRGRLSRTDHRYPPSRPSSTLPDFHASVSESMRSLCPAIPLASGRRPELARAIERFIIGD